MARLSKQQWEAARVRWESEPELTFGRLAVDLDLSRPAVSKRADAEGWVKGASVPAQEKVSKVTPAGASRVTKVTPEVSTPKGGGKASSQPKDAPPPASRMSSADWELMTRRPVGRPTSYRDEYVDEIVRYFDIPVESVIDVDVAGKDGTMTTQKQVVINTFPTLSRFASSLGVTRDTLYEWAHGKNTDGSLKHPEFSYAYARAKDLQDALLTEGGMSGRYEGRFAVFAAKNIIGWKDQIETTTEVTLKTASTEQLDDAYQRGIEESARQRALVMARKVAGTDEAGN